MAGRRLPRFNLKIVSVEKIRPDLFEYKLSDGMEFNTPRPLMARAHVLKAGDTVCINAGYSYQSVTGPNSISYDGVTVWVSQFGGSNRRVGDGGIHR